MDEILLILLGIAWALGTPIIAIVALVARAPARPERAAGGGPRPRSSVRWRGAARCRRRSRRRRPKLRRPHRRSNPSRRSSAPVDAAGRRAGGRARSGGWEQRLGARAFLWVGAITLALAAVFLVRYSIDEGYLSPEVRVILAALFGLALIGGAERMRPRDERVAQALAAAGVASLYGALFAAVALYEMISKVAAGGGAAALTAFAIGVSLRHGIFVAGLAFIGGFASPAIIGSETPNTPVLFGYLLAIAAGALGVIRCAAGGRSAGACWRARQSGPSSGCCPWPAACIGSACSWSPSPACSCGRRGGAWASARTHRPTSLPLSGPRWLTGASWWLSSSRTRQAGRWLAGARGARRWPFHARPLDAALPTCGGARSASVALTLALWWGRRWAGDRAGTPTVSSGSRSFLAASTPQRPSRCCGTQPGRASGQHSPSPPHSLIFSSAGTCCVALRPAHHGV